MILLCSRELDSYFVVGRNAQRLLVGSVRKVDGVVLQSSDLCSSRSCAALFRHGSWMGRHIHIPDAAIVWSKITKHLLRRQEEYSHSAGLVFGSVCTALDTGSDSDRVSSLS